MYQGLTLLAAVAWVGLLIFGAVTTWTQRSRRRIIVVLTVTYLSVGGAILVVAERRTGEYYWTSEFLEPTPDGGLRVPVPSASDLVLAFTLTHIGVALTFASLLAISRIRGSVVVLLSCGAASVAAELLVRAGTWWALLVYREQPIDLSVAAVSYLLPPMIGGVVVATMWMVWTRIAKDKRIRGVVA